MTHAKLRVRLLNIIRVVTWFKGSLVFSRHFQLVHSTPRVWSKSLSILLRITSHYLPNHPRSSQFPVLFLLDQAPFVLCMKSGALQQVHTCAFVWNPRVPKADLVAFCFPLKPSYFTGCVVYAHADTYAIERRSYSNQIAIAQRANTLPHKEFWNS